MGTIYALCGPSGVGKTTFLTLLENRNISNLKFLRRSTNRDKRPDEIEQFEYDFYSYQSFISKVFSGDFVHVEQYSNNLYGIETGPIEDTINSDNDGIIMAGIHGAKKLKYLYPKDVSIQYMFVQEKRHLMDHDCLSDNYMTSDELKFRLSKRINDGKVEVPIVEVQNYINRRMQLNWFELAYVNGSIRRKITDLDIIVNKRDDINNCVDTFCNHLISHKNSKPKTLEKVFKD